MNTNTINLKRISILFMVVLIAFTTFSFNTSAATSGGTNTRTICVTTKANWAIPGSESITLTQKKQTINMYKTLNRKKTKTKSGYYGCYKISIYNITKGKTSTVWWNGGKTKKVSLARNCSYNIKVSYDSTRTWLNQINAIPWNYTMKNATSPSWYVSGTWKVSSYY